MPPRKSVFRQPGARHFQVVHRSQRDPLIYDVDASKHVLKEYARENEKKGQSRAELEATLRPEDLAHDLTRPNIGEAALYGVYYDDTSYDYMQHLKPVGVHEAGVENIMLEAPGLKNKGKGKESWVIRDDLPAEALPSKQEMPRTYEHQEAVPSSIAGFQPDLDPHLRQTLEALEDDAFVDDDLEDDFFGELITGGERPKEEDPDFDFDEDGFAEAFAKAARLEAKAETGASAGAEGGEDEGWESRFAAFKNAQKTGETAAGPSSDIDEMTEGGDTVGTLPRLPVIGGKRRRKGASDASGYSMSSSSMFRNEGLTSLDERFDQIEKQYEEDEEPESGTTSDDDEAPELITSREDFEAMMDDFLDNYEVLGRKMEPTLAGDTPAEKLAQYRQTLAEGGRIQIREIDDDDNDDDILMPAEVGMGKDRWDCETILSTYSNMENHPRMIRARDHKATPKIRIDPRTGLPTVEEVKPKERRTSKKDSTLGLSSATDETSDDDADRPVRVTIARAKDESKEDKKARKQAAKMEKQTRRVEKKTNQERFASEFKKQSKMLANRDDRRLHAM